MKFNEVLRRYHSLVQEIDVEESGGDEEFPHPYALDAVNEHEDYSPDPERVLVSFADFLYDHVDLIQEDRPGFDPEHGQWDDYQASNHWMTYVTWSVDRHMIAVSDETMARTQVDDAWLKAKVSLLDRFGSWSAYIQIPKTTCRIGTIFGAFIGISCDQFGRNLFVAPDLGLDRNDYWSLPMLFYQLDGANTFADVIKNIGLHVNPRKFEDCSLDLFYEMLNRQAEEPDGVGYDSVEDFLDAKTEIAGLFLPLFIRALEPGVERRLYALPAYVSTRDEQMRENTVKAEALEQLSEDEALKQFTPLKGDLLPERRQITCLEDARPVNPQVLFI